MGKYFVDSERVRVDFPDGNWVDVKEELSQEDQDYILSQMAKAEAVGKSAQLTMSLGKLALLERSIVAWSFVDDKEQAVPVTRDSISNLRLKYRSLVLKEINRLNEQAEEFVSKNA